FPTSEHHREEHEDHYTTNVNHDLSNGYEVSAQSSIETSNADQRCQQEDTGVHKIFGQKHSNGPTDGEECRKTEKNFSEHSDSLLMSAAEHEVSDGLSIKHNHPNRTANEVEDGDWGEVLPANRHKLVYAQTWKRPAHPNYDIIKE